MSERDVSDAQRKWVERELAARKQSMVWLGWVDKYRKNGQRQDRLMAVTQHRVVTFKMKGVTKAVRPRSRGRSRRAR